MPVGKEDWKMGGKEYWHVWSGCNCVVGGGEICGMYLFVGDKEVGVQALGFEWVGCLLGSNMVGDRFR